MFSGTQLPLLLSQLNENNQTIMVTNRRKEWERSSPCLITIGSGYSKLDSSQIILLNHSTDNRHFYQQKCLLFFISNIYNQFKPITLCQKHQCHPIKNIIYDSNIKKVFFIIINNNNNNNIFNICIYFIILIKRNTNHIID